jgi:hypothetical protein
MSKLKQARKIKRIKDIRVTVSKLEVKKAKDRLSEAKALAAEAEENLEKVSERAVEKRNEELRRLLTVRTDHSVHNEHALNVYLRSYNDVSKAKSEVRQAHENVAEAGERLKTAQDLLAQRLRDQNKAEELVTRGTEQANLDAVRQG